MSRVYEVRYHTNNRVREKFPNGDTIAHSPFPPELITDNQGNLLYRVQSKHNTSVYIRTEDVVFIGKKVESIVEGIRLERRKGWVQMYIASPLIPVAFIDIGEEHEPLALRTNFYCNATGVDRVMWQGYTRAGVRIVA